MKQIAFFDISSSLIFRCDGACLHSAVLNHGEISITIVFKLKKFSCGANVKILHNLICENRNTWPGGGKTPCGQQATVADARQNIILTGLADNQADFNHQGPVGANVCVSILRNVDIEP